MTQRVHHGPTASDSFCTAVKRLSPSRGKSPLFAQLANAFSKNARMFSAQFFGGDRNHRARPIRLSFARIRQLIDTLNYNCFRESLTGFSGHPHDFVANLSVGFCFHSGNSLSHLDGEAAV